MSQIKLSGGAFPLLSVVLGLTGIGALSAPVAAQSEGRGVLEEVVVTARRRAENLQDTPIAVSAVGADTLERLGISDIEDIETLAPSPVSYTHLTLPTTPYV